MMNMEFKPKLCKEIVWKEEGKNGEIVSLASALGGPIRMLNPVASKIIKLSDGKHTVKEIISEICRTFDDANQKEVEKDVEKFLAALEKNQIINPSQN